MRFLIEVCEDSNLHLHPTLKPEKREIFYEKNNDNFQTIPWIVEYIFKNPRITPKSREIKKNDIKLKFPCESSDIISSRDRVQISHQVFYIAKMKNIYKTPLIFMHLFWHRFSREHQWYL